MRHRPLPPLAAMLLGLVLAGGPPMPADAAPGRLKLVRPGGTTEQWPAQVNGWWTLVDQSGNLNVEPYFDWIGFVEEGQAPAAFGGKFGVINGVGDWRVTPRYEQLDRFADGYAVFRRGGKAGFIDVAGTEVLGPELIDARRFREGLAAVRTAAGCGYINTSIRVVVPPIFAVARSLHQGFGVVAVDVPAPGTATARTLERLADTPLDELIDPQVLAQPAAKKDQTPTRLWGCVNRSGRLVWLDRTGRVEAVGDFGDNLAPVRIDGKWGFMNRAFRLTVEPRWDEARPFEGGYAAVRLGEKWGYVNAAGRLAIEPRWDHADDFDEILALVRLGELWGFIDVSGQVAIEPQFSEAEAFENGLARVNAGWAKQPDAFGYINVAGQIIFDPRLGDQEIVDIRRGGPGEITVNGTFSGVNGTSKSRRSPVFTSPPHRPTPELPVIPDHLYDEGLSVDDPVSGRGPEGDTANSPALYPPASPASPATPNPPATPAAPTAPTTPAAPAPTQKPTK